MGEFFRECIPCWKYNNTNAMRPKIEYWHNFEVFYWCPHCSFKVIHHCVNGEPVFAATMIKQPDCPCGKNKDVKFKLIYMGEFNGK